MAAAKMSTARIQDLATAKGLPAGFLENRMSVYWENGISEKDYSRTTTFALTPRQDQLVYSKRLHSEYRGDRPSPIWPVSLGAMAATPTQRTTRLAQSKSLHSDYRPCRQVMTVIPSTTLRARPTERLRCLARHKTYPPLPIKTNGQWDWGEWDADITAAARTASASARVITLATPKEPHSLYQPAKRVQWPVTKEARSHNASERTYKLARPKNRHLDQEDYDHRAWSVSVAALNAKPTPRLEELATPIPRKIRSKK